MAEVPHLRWVAFGRRAGAHLVEQPRALNLNHYQWPEFKSDLGHLQHDTPTFLLPFPATIFNPDTFDLYFFFLNISFAPGSVDNAFFYVAMKKDYCC